MDSIQYTGVPKDAFCLTMWCLLIFAALCNIISMTITAYVLITKNICHIKEKKSKDVQMKAVVRQRLVETGERERLKELLRTRLIECGWKEELKAYCKETVKEKGVENITVDDLVVEITPKGRELVPDSVKRELLQKIRAFLEEQNI